MARDTDKYLDCLVQIKTRTEIIRQELALIAASKEQDYLEIKVEFLCLQLRKILELIALSSLVANKEEYAKQREKFSKDWNANLIFKDLERINPNFYPVPTNQTPSRIEGVIFDLQPISEEYLTQKDFIEIFNKCGGVLHSTNPYSEKKDFTEILKDFSTWLNKIVKLLNHHNIVLADGETMIIGLMHGSKDGKPQVTEFKRVLKK
jgi:hypothetical protein